MGGRQVTSMFYNQFTEDYEEIFPFREKVFSFLKKHLPADKSTVLDIGCATGHYCGRFASEDYGITGIDLDSGMIAGARKNYPGAEFITMDMRDAGSLGSRFDLAYSTGNVAAHLPRLELKKFLASLKTVLKKNGIWIFQVLNWDYITKLDSYNFPDRETKTKIFTRSYSSISHAGINFNTMLKNKNNGKIVFRESVKLYPVLTEDYIAAHKESGFALAGHFSDYNETQYDSEQNTASIFIFKLSEKTAGNSMKDREEN